MEPLSPTIDNPVWFMEKESQLNSVFMLGDCVHERLALEVVLRYGLAN